MSTCTVEEARAKFAGKKVVFTNGVFDILHAGHVRYLTAARALGDALVVGLNSDDSVRMLGKGPNRPVHSEADRAEVLAALRCVDALILFEEKTPERLISELQPAIHVKGGDYRPEDLPEKAVIDAYGGKIVIMPTLEGRSTTAALKKMGVE